VKSTLRKTAGTALPLLSFLFGLAIAPEPVRAGTPVELGAVNWLRDFDRGAEVARKTGKPVLLLFSEVPG
jgi:hypothetical protein